jgi:formylglycine-generating enzyme required for sulfatase activity
MAEDEKGANPNVHAEDNSTAVGKIEVGGSVGGSIIIGGTHIYAEPRDAEKVFAPLYFEPETVLIPEGPFWMGGPAGDGIPAHETTQTEITLRAYRIGKYPVTNAQYQEFVNQTKTLVAPALGWDGQRVPDGKENHPVAGVTFFEALAYCRWLSEKTGRSYSVPNEAQWEKACRGGGKSLYPWGDEFDDRRCNHGRADVAPVDQYPAQNEIGCFDLVGNVLQWTCTLWGKKRFPPDLRYAYPWKDDGRNLLEANSEIRRVVRGSAMSYDVLSHRCSARSGQIPEDRGLAGARHGFRVVMFV